MAAVSLLGIGKRSAIVDTVGYEVMFDLAKLVKNEYDLRCALMELNDDINFVNEQIQMFRSLKTKFYKDKDLRRLCSRALGMLNDEKEGLLCQKESCLNIGTRLNAFAKTLGNATESPSFLPE